MGRHLLFVTGTRADLGKIKPLLEEVRKGGYKLSIFATGMHLQSIYGETHYEISKSGFKYFPFMNHSLFMDETLANTVNGLGKYVREIKPDLIVVHGDRVESLAGAIVGALNNILVAHIEGGELSGTVDESIRHSVSKLAHVHFVSNEESKSRLERMGENNIFVIGSPDIDVMLSDKLPSMILVRRKYGIEYKNYSIFCYHPVTTELEYLQDKINIICAALCRSGRKYIVIYPNNDAGSDIIIRAIEKLPFKKLPSMRFEHYLTLLKNADCIVGNSSAGVREAPVYGVPVVNIGTRQNKRASSPNILNVSESFEEILFALNNLPKAAPSFHYGKGDSARKFIEILPFVFDIPIQKEFRDEV